MSRVVTGSETVSSHPTSYDSGYSAYSVSNLNNALKDSGSTSNYAQINLKRGTNAVTQIFYNFSFNIPAGSTITAISCTATCLINQTGNTRVSTRQIQLYAGSTAKGSASTVANSTSLITMSPGTTSDWSVSDINNAKIRLYAVRGNSNTSSSYYFRFYGATMSVTYSYNYTLYTVTSSSTVSGVTITPASEEYAEGTDASLTINGDITGATVTDNGTDVTSELSYHQYTNPSYLVGNIIGASYGFALSNGWYESQNKGVNNSAAICRVSVSSVVQCRVTFTYINYAESTYDFGIFSKADTALTLDYPVSSSSSGDTTIDNGLYEKRCNSSSDNSSSQQTLQYTLSAGEHFIDVKFGKDAATASNNDSLKFKVTITPLETIPTGGYYIYKIAQIDADHTVLVSKVATGDKIYIKLPSNRTLVGSATNNDNDNALTISINNGVIVPGDIVTVEFTNIKGWYSGAATTIDDYSVTFTHAYGMNTYYASGNSGPGVYCSQSAPVGQWTYNISMSPRHSSQSYSFTGNMFVYKITGGGWTLADDIYIKRSGVWEKLSKSYKKENGAWVEQTSLLPFFNTNILTIYANN